MTEQTETFSKWMRFVQEAKLAEHFHRAKVGGREWVDAAIESVKACDEDDSLRSVQTPEGEMDAADVVEKLKLDDLLDSGQRRII